MSIYGKTFLPTGRSTKNSLGRPHIVLDHPHTPNPSKPHVTPTLENADKASFFPSDDLLQLVLRPPLFSVVIVVFVFRGGRGKTGEVAGERSWRCVEDGDEEWVRPGCMRQAFGDDHLPPHS